MFATEICEKLHMDIYHTGMVATSHELLLYVLEGDSYLLLRIHILGNDEALTFHECY